MGRLAEIILELIHDERYMVSEHASERLEGREIIEWQAIEATVNGQAVEERPKALPNPVVEFMGLLPDGAEVKIVWAYHRRIHVAKLVTVDYLD